MRIEPDFIDDFPGPALIIDADARIVRANTAADDLSKQLSDSEAPELMDVLRTAVREGRTGSFDISFDPIDGRQAVYNLMIVPSEEPKGALLLAQEATLERNLSKALSDSRQRYRDLVEISTDLAWETDADGTFVFASPRGGIGYEASDLVDRNFRDFLCQRDDEEARLVFLARKQIQSVEIWMRDKTGAERLISVSATPVTNESGEWSGARGVCSDVTGRHKQEEQLAHARVREELLTHIVRTIRDEVEPSNMLVAAAQATARAVGAVGCRVYRANQSGAFSCVAEYGVLGDSSPLDNVVNKLRHQNLSVQDEVGSVQAIGVVTFNNRGQNGAMCLWRRKFDPDDPVATRPWSDDEKLLIVDIANQMGIALEQIASHERIITLSRTDSLTGLLNRRAFFDELERRYNRLARSKNSSALVYVDLDNFKLVNDIHGHQRGDSALIKLRDVLIGGTRPGDLIGRLGGDEFALWLDGIDISGVSNRADSLLQSGRSLRAFSGKSDRPLGLSLGIAMTVPGSGETLKQLIARADAAMYEVKRTGKGNYYIDTGKTSDHSDDK
jgi:diguanylate cyclase (GGDEF)-like protein/PAS domain S-box-containing protein